MLCFSHYSCHEAKSLQKHAKQGKILMMKVASSLQEYTVVDNVAEGCVISHVTILL